MKTWVSRAVGAAVLAMSVTTVTLVSTRPGARSVGPIEPAEAKPTFSRDFSAGLFVGVASFPDDNLLTVPYAADDAVDLAYQFAFNQKIALIPPRNITLALSGNPQKEESQRRLAELLQAGAQRKEATQSDIYNLLLEQSRLAARGGLLVVSFATHGFQHQGDSYILGSKSTIGSPDNSLRLASLLDIASRARSSVIFVDACRDRKAEDVRGGSADSRTEGAHLQKLVRYPGQVIFYAAAPGQYAYDDLVHRNGVFTKAVIDGLNCGASAPRKTVIVETLHTFVERNVRKWLQENNKPYTPSVAVTQLSVEGRARNMPLAECWRCPGPALHASTNGSKLFVSNEAKRPIWNADLRQPILHTAVADLDADARNEVIVGLRDRIVVFDRDGKSLWSTNGDGMSLHKFAIGDLFEKRTQQIVAIWNDAKTSASRLTILEKEGHEYASFEHPRAMEHVAIGRPNNHWAPRIAVTAGDTLLLFRLKQIGKGKPDWSQRISLSPREAIEGLRIIDPKDRSPRKIEVATKNSAALFDFEGKLVQRTQR